MVEQSFNQPAVLSSSCSTCYSMWPKTLSNLMPWEADDSESNFNLARGTQHTRMGIDAAFAHATFPLSFQSVDPGHPPRLQSLTTLHPYVATKNINPTSTERVQGRSTRRSNQVLKPTDYHISRHVASTFKRLTKWATHRDLSQFLTTPARYHNYTTPPVVLI